MQFSKFHYSLAVWLLNYKSKCSRCPAGQKWGERGQRASEATYTVGREARRPQAGSLPWAGLREFFCFLSPQNDVVWGEFFYFFFVCEMGLTWRMEEKEMEQEKWKKEMEEKRGESHKERNEREGFSLWCSGFLFLVLFFTLVLSFFIFWYFRFTLALLFV